MQLMNKLLSILPLISSVGFGQVKLNQIEKATGSYSTVTTNTVGTLGYVPEQTLSISGQSLSISRGNTVTIPTNSTSLVAGNNMSVTTSGLSYTVTLNKNLSTEINQYKATNIASSSTCDIGAANGNLIHITGTTTINSFGTIQAGTERTLVFDTALTIATSTNIVLPNSLSISTSTNDIAIFRSEGSGVWRLVTYQVNSGAAITYSPTYTGFSTPPSGGINKYILNGKLCTVWIAPTSDGTSNATSFTITLPFNAADLVGGSLAFTKDNGSITVGGYGLTTAGSNVLTLTKQSGAAWTASSTKRAVFTFQYMIQ